MKKLLRTLFALSAVLGVPTLSHGTEQMPYADQTCEQIRATFDSNIEAAVVPSFTDVYEDEVTVMVEVGKANNKYITLVMPLPKSREEIQSIIAKVTPPNNQKPLLQTFVVMQPMQSQMDIMAFAEPYDTTRPCIFLGGRKLSQ